MNFTSVNYTKLFSNLSLNYTTEEREVDYVYYGNELTLNCPNYKNTLLSYTDPDEDDRYSYVTYNFDMEGHDYSICGNNEKKFTALLSADGCDVGTDLKVTLTDSGGLTDEKYFENVIRCGPDDKNGCCGLNGEWMDGQVGGCGSENEISLIAVTKEQHLSMNATNAVTAFVQIVKNQGLERLLVLAVRVVLNVVVMKLNLLKNPSYQDKHNNL